MRTRSAAHDDVLAHPVQLMYTFHAHVFGSMWEALSGPDDLADGGEGLGDARVSRRLQLVAVESILFKFQLLNHQKNRKTFKE